MTGVITEQTPSEWLLEQFDNDPSGYYVRGSYNPTIFANIKWDHEPFCPCETGSGYYFVNTLHSEPL